MTRHTQLCRRGIRTRSLKKRSILTGGWNFERSLLLILSIYSLGMLCFYQNDLVAHETVVCPSSEIHISDQQFKKAVESLGQLVAIPSVSNPFSSDYNIDHLTSASEKIGSQLKELGFKVMHPCIEGSPPFIIAEYISDPAKPTVLLYAHYDVQPVDREKWNTDPFIMQEREGRLYGRGASDDKAGIIAIISALETCFSSDKPLTTNIKLLFEGEEEYGSTHLKTLLEQYSMALEADALIVLDGLNQNVHTGTLTSSTRGLVTLDLKVHALEKPIHSGMGCLAPDPAQALAGLIYSLRDPKAIEGFLDDARQLNENEREMLASNSQSAECYAKDVGVIANACLRGDPKQSIYERIVIEPSISVINMKCGQPNGGNSIQESASCTIGIRLTPGQNPSRIAEVMIQHLKKQATLFDLPMEVIQKTQGAWAWMAELSGSFSQKYITALKENFVNFSAMPLGGTLPLLREFQEMFPSMEMIVPGVEDPQTSAHSHNESQDISILRNSINALIAFFYK